ncbi:GTP pyrophosphokinase [Adhaeribacter terreus]|uniref:GTP pyrophosphokinase family protein n=1 Tax=Adhaeribacter terreus TaxID=529703 RepID=A0ABW0ECS4_9BACT
MNSFVERERDLRELFAAIEPFLKEWGDLVDLKVMEFLAVEGNDFDLAAVKIKPKNRVKDLDSFIQKALHRGKKYSNPLLEIEDKVGTRVVLLTNENISKVTSILSKQEFWECKVDRDREDRISQNVKEFDYQAYHLIVKPMKGAFDVPDKFLPFISCEIQVKTLFQHAYAEVSHDTVYKGAFTQDRYLLRTLAKSMALMEATDDFFCEMFNYINSNQNVPNQFLRELINLYANLDPTFKTDGINLSLDALIIEELEKVNVLQKLRIERINEFVQSNVTKLKRIINLENFLISSHPIIIMIAYLLEKRVDDLKNCDLDGSMLEAVALNLGVSYQHS